MARVNYTPAKRRIAKTDMIVIHMLHDALWIDERKVMQTRARAELETHIAWFEARMKALLEGLKEYDER